MCKCGLPTIVYDIDEVAVRELVDGGAKPTSGAAEVATAGSSKPDYEKLRGQTY